jgi:hypothetical protein
MSSNALELTDRLDHEWRDETVSFAAAHPDAVAEAVRDEAGALHAVQRDETGRAVFRLDRLPACGTRRLELVGTDAPPPGPAAPPTARKEEGGTVVLENERMAVRVPAETEGRFPAPLQAVRRAGGQWVGRGALHVCPDLSPARVESACAARGPLYLVWRLRYVCQSGADYTLDLRLDAGRPWLEVTEASSLAHDAGWRFEVPGAERFWTHPHQFRANQPSRVRAVEEARAEGRSDLGDVQLPIFGGIWVQDDYAYGAWIAGNTAVAAVGVHGRHWDYPYANALRFALEDEAPALRASVKAGHRRWLLMGRTPPPWRKRRPITRARPTSP